MQKSQKNFECQFFINLEKPHFGHILVPFRPKNLKQVSSQKNDLGKL